MSDGGGPGMLAVQMRVMFLRSVARRGERNPFEAMGCDWLSAGWMVGEGRRGEISEW